MTMHERVNILLVDDQPAKLLSYEVILRELDETLLTANSAQEAFAHLLKSDVAVVLVDVCMPDLDGFELARMIREHPRFQKTAIIFISAVLLTHLDFMRGYESGAVDYVPVPVVPEILRAKVKVFAELYRKTRQLERLNHELEERVAERTAELERSAAELRRSEERLRLAFDAAQMGWWDYDIEADRVTWSPSLVRIMGFSPETFGARLEGALAHIHPEDRDRFLALVQQGIAGESSGCELRFIRPDGSVRWSLAAGQVIRSAGGRPLHFAGVDLDITARKQAEERQRTLVHELDHRAKNLLAVVQSVLHLSHGDSVPSFIAAVDGRIKALSRAHSLLSESRWQGVDLRRIIEEEIAPFVSTERRQVATLGPALSLRPDTGQSLALALHELVTNAVKYGALSTPRGRVSLSWDLEPDGLVLHWSETGGPATVQPARQGFGTKAIVASVERQLGGRVSFDWRPEGLHCCLAVPRSSVRAPHRSEDGEPRPEPAQAPQPLTIGGRRILVVEDEALVAILVHDVLDALGFTVVGPVATMAQALALAKADPIDAAILDVNLGGEPIYPVADALTARGIPFVFVTGYNTDAIDRRYGHVAALEKPIEPDILRSLFVERRDEPGLPAGIAAAARPPRHVAAGR
jgi:PAS domain S-box-containing protein